MNNKQKGFTLAELLATLSIAATLSTLGVSGLNQISQQFDKSAAKNDLISLIKASRARAITDNSYTTICHLVNNKCSDFSNTITAFSDKNNNKTLDSDEQVIGRVNINNNTEITWNRHERLRFQANGFAGGYNGTLTYCHQASDDAFKIVISRTGRTRYEALDSCS